MRKDDLERVGKKVVKLADACTSLAVAILLLLLLCYGAYATWDGRQVSTDAGMSQYQAYKPQVEDKYSYDQLVKLNQDVFSWLTVYGTGIDYPVVQGQDNEEYINTDATGKYRMSGSIFMDYRNQRDYTDFNSILFGHHMAQEAMFGDLDKFLDRQFFDSHQYGNLFYQGQDHGIEFFAMLDVDAFDNSVYYTPVVGSERQQQYLDALLQKALFRRDIGVTTADRLLILSTCSSDATNGRHVLVGRITSHKIPVPDSLVDHSPVNFGKDLMNTKAASILGDLGRKPVLLFLLYMLLLLALFLIYDRLRKRRLGGKASKGGAK